MSDSLLRRKSKVVTLCSTSKTGGTIASAKYEFPFTIDRVTQIVLRSFSLTYFDIAKSGGGGPNFNVFLNYLQRGISLKIITPGATLSGFSVFAGVDPFSDVTFTFPVWKTYRDTTNNLPETYRTLNYWPQGSIETQVITSNINVVFNTISEMQLELTFRGVAPNTTITQTVDDVLKDPAINVEYSLSLLLYF